MKNYDFLKNFIYIHDYYLLIFYNKKFKIKLLNKSLFGCDGMLYDRYTYFFNFLHKTYDIV